MASQSSLFANGDLIREVEKAIRHPLAERSSDQQLLLTGEVPLRERVSLLSGSGSTDTDDRVILADRDNVEALSDENLRSLRVVLNHLRNLGSRRLRVSH